MSDSITFSLVGDIMMGTTFPDSTGGSHLPPNRGRNLFDDCRDITTRVDVACGNLEGSFLSGPAPHKKTSDPANCFIFRMPPEYVENLTDAGFDFLGIANNHISDFGATGRRSTMKTLSEASLAYAGLKGVCETTYLTRNGLRIGLTQFGHGGVNLPVTDLSELKRVVKQLSDSADIVVVAFHGGAEGSSHTHVPHATEMFLGENRGDVEAFAHAAIDAGADMVYGHGPHVPRAAEIYKGHIIFYSLGNFCTPYRMGITGATGLAPLAEVTLNRDGSFRHGKIHSFAQQRGRGPVADPSNEAARFIKRLSAEDFPGSPLQIADDGCLSVSPISK
ncbi:MAG: CapA family protein [Bacteroides sp.]|nr:CapA family protein [Bacteroides sp.]